MSASFSKRSFYSYSEEQILINMKESEAERKHKSATVPGSPHAKTNLRQSSIPDSTLWIPGTDS